MNRRGFLGLLGAAIAGIALEQAIPLGRVWSFPRNIVIPPKPIAVLGIDFGFDPATRITVRHVYLRDRVTGSVWQRTELLNQHGVFEPMGGWGCENEWPPAPCFDRFIQVGRQDSPLLPS